MRFTFVLIVHIICLTINAQLTQIKNIVVEQTRTHISINYDLVGISENDLFCISLFVSTDGGITYSPKLKEVTGDIGLLQKGGIGKQIKWDVLKEVRQLNSDSVLFKISADILPDFMRNFILVEGGTFQMGDNSSDDGKPMHEVSIDNFYINKFETTVSDYKKYCAEANKPMPNIEMEWIEDHPITFVSWDDAHEYCTWLSTKTGKIFRLPTEAEWEFAAKGGSKTKNTKYSGSDNINNVGWTNENSIGVTHSKIGSLSANELGLYDMTGNVWEWCADWYSQNYYEQSASQNPKGPRTGVVRVARGGSWFHPTIPVSYRFYISPSAKSNYVGFRLVMEN